MQYGRFSNRVKLTLFSYFTEVELLLTVVRLNKDTRDLIAE